MFHIYHLVVDHHLLWFYFLVAGLFFLMFLNGISSKGELIGSLVGVVSWFPITVWYVFDAHVLKSNDWKLTALAWLITVIIFVV